jgi:hypothetical protein
MEKQRKQGRKLAHLKQKRHNPVAKLLSSEAGIASSWHTKDDLERVSIQENQRRFSQTAATPPMQPWILELVGYAGNQPAATAILDGAFAIPAHIDPYFTRLLNALRMPESVRRLGPIPTSISTAEHIRGWRCQRERTGSVRTDLGFADHISATYHQGMAEIDRLLRQIPYAAGFSPIAHQKLLDFAILKKSGVFDVELMRIIPLMVASFNMNNKLTGRMVMTRAEQLRLIPPEQSGSRKKKRSILTLLNTVLTMDILRLRQPPMAICSNDAKSSCYDRIVLWIAALCL